MNIKRAKNLKPGTRVVLGAQFWSTPFGNLVGRVFSLKRVECGAWVAEAPGFPFDELFIGSGYDFELAAA